MFIIPNKMKSELISVTLSFNDATLPQMIQDKINWPDEFKEMSKSNMTTQSIQTVENEYEFEYHMTNK